MKGLFRAWIAAAALCIAPESAAFAAERTVVVTLFDGFSPAMADATQTPNLDRIKREGVWSRHLVPAFPTLSMIQSHILCDRMLARASRHYVKHFLRPKTWPLR